jgi:hypothetical protein
MLKLNGLVAGAVMLLAIPALASADTLIGSFSGAANHNGPAPGVYAAGNDYKVYATLDNTQDFPWYPWDQVTYEYTLFIDTDVFSYTVSGLEQTVDFTVATFRIYRDDRNAGTAASYANVATFTDGTLILNGSIQNMIGDRLDIFGLPYAVTGIAVFTGGADRASLHSFCDSGAVLNDFINFQIGTPPAGFDEFYDAEWKCVGSTSLDESTWGQMKAIYR